MLVALGYFWGQVLFPISFPRVSRGIYELEERNVGRRMVSPCFQMAMAKFGVHTQQREPCRDNLQGKGQL